ncbi:MAG: hypothetical protein R2754_07925 [Microthrixaceae bacterium]
MADGSAPQHPILRRLGGSTVRLAMVAGIVALVGLGIGQAMGQAVSQLPDPTEGAVVLDQLSLGGIEPTMLLLQKGEVPADWETIEPFPGMVGGDWCGEQVETTGIRSSPVDTVTFSQPESKALLISEVASFDRPQFAANYVSDVTEVMLSCPSYFQPLFDGSKQKIEVTEPDEPQPITDYVSRVLQPEDRSNYDVRTLFQVGSSVVGLHYAGPERPPRNLLANAEEAILARVSPDDFGDTSTTVVGVEPLPAESTNTLNEDGLEQAPDGDQADNGIPPPTIPGSPESPTTQG